MLHPLLSPELHLVPPVLLSELSGWETKGALVIGCGWLLTSSWQELEWCEMCEEANKELIPRHSFSEFSLDLDSTLLLRLGFSSSELYS